MKINLLYLVVPLAAGLCAYIVRDLQGQSEQTFFGAAETEPSVLNMEEDVRVREVFVSAGDQVRQGDTLALFYRKDLDRESLSNTSAYRLQEATHQTRLDMLARERETLLAQSDARISELLVQIRQIELMDSIDQSVKAAIFPGSKIERTPSDARIASLRKEVDLMKNVVQQQLRELDAQAAASEKITGVKQFETRLMWDFEQAERRDLALIAPVEGYVDQVHIAPRMPVQAFKEMLRIYPLRPTKVIGFIHESAEILFRIGDPVTLTSSVRTTAPLQGVIGAVSPKLVELPLRLRKFTEVRAWGREVIILLPPDNPYYIGERITISLQMPSK